MESKQLVNWREWHKSQEGRTTLGEKAKSLWKIRPMYTVNCLQCGESFRAKQIERAKYCSNKCTQTARRQRAADLINRECVICSKSFKVNKFSKTKTCGLPCGFKLRSKASTP